ncbi:hypothetical protein TNCV_1373931 [Trichonephila clavipes]|nr:hypothetical protein TNCV_1373931 [Trichonephila clavipes]
MRIQMTWKKRGDMDWAPGVEENVKLFEKLKGREGYFENKECIRAGGRHPFWHIRRVGRLHQHPGQASGGILPKSHVRWLVWEPRIIDTMVATPVLESLSVGTLEVEGSHTRKKTNVPRDCKATERRTYVNDVYKHDDPIMWK